MLQVGDRAPEFELPDDSGRIVRLSKQLNEGPLVLYFYPADFTPACTEEACMFRDAQPGLSLKGIRVFGVSPQALDIHAKFRRSYALPFVLLSDPERLAIAAYGVDGFLGLVRRTSYLIGQDGTILDSVQADFQIGPHKDFLCRALMTIKARQQKIPG